MVDYAAWLRVGLTIDIVSGVVFLAFGMFAALKRPRTKAGLAAALFALGWASIGIYPNVRVLMTQSNPGVLGVAPTESTVFSIAGFLLVGAGALWLGRILCGRWPRTATGNGILLIAAAVAILSAWNSWRVAPELGVLGTRRFLFAATNALAATVTPALLWLAVSVPERHKAGLVAFAVLPLAGTWSLTNAVDFVHAGRWTPAVAMGLALVISIPAIARRRAPPALAWTVSWWFAALAWGWALAGHDAQDLGLIGLTRLLAVGILVYAVVRHRAFDIDVKLRFTLKQSTIAAIFVAVFVAVQAGVGEAVTARAGILAGAMVTAILVFALGPIQRVAERLAETAMPHAVPLAQRSVDDRATLFEALAREAWSDGSINTKEARVLETAWRRLGLTADQASSIESRARGS